MKTVTCNKCGTVAFQVSREFAVNQVEEFIKYYNTLTREQQLDYYGGKPATLAGYEGCMFCGGSYKNFRDSVPGDCPEGCTLSPIIDREQ